MLMLGSCIKKAENGYQNQELLPGLCKPPVLDPIVNMSMFLFIIQYYRHFVDQTKRIMYPVISFFDSNNPSLSDYLLSIYF